MERKEVASNAKIWGMSLLGIRIKCKGLKEGFSILQKEKEGLCLECDR